MLRLRFLRLLLPLALVLFLVALALALRERPAAVGGLLPTDDDARRRIEGLHIVDLDGASKSLELRAESAEEGADGRIRLRRISELAVARVDESPLIISAEAGVIEGAAGERRMRFDGDVVLRDPEQSLVLVLPRLEVDEVEAAASSDAEIRFEAPGLEGRAAGGLRYRLDGAPSELYEVELTDERQGRLTSARALLHDGLDDVEFPEQVRVEREGRRFDGGRLRLIRDADKRLRRATARSGVRGSVPSSAAAAPFEFEGDTLELLWGATGELTSGRLGGRAVLRRGAETLSAASIALRRSDPAAPDAPWRVEAAGAVFAQATVGGSPVWLHADRLVAEVTRERVVSSARASGRVSVDGPETRAEADEAVFAERPGEPELELLADEGRKARLARGPTRVAADRIRTDRRGDTLLADGRVEATLLPGPPGGAKGDGLQGLFLSDEAVHFVAAALESRDSARRLSFRGGVRGWQGERNLSAERVSIDHVLGELQAREQVTTRLPRSPERSGLVEGDFIQVAADRLDYGDRARLGVYEGAVRVKLAEGWLEARRVEVQLAGPGEGIREIRAFDRVRVEFRDSTTAEPELVAGTSDRLLYSPGGATVRLYGDSSPATVRRIGGSAGVTSGRVLRYQLDLGTLEVDSGDRGPARIRTQGAAETP